MKQTAIVVSLALLPALVEAQQLTVRTTGIANPPIVLNSTEIAKLPRHSVVITDPERGGRY
jgi:hypothetical protein